MVFTEISLEDEFVVVGDLHLEKREIVIVDGKKRITVTKRKLVRWMLEHVQDAAGIIFNGDTAETRFTHASSSVTGSHSPEGIDELKWLLSTLDELELLEKSTLVRGNHDHNIREFAFTGEVNVRDYCLIRCGKTYALVVHGDRGGYADTVRRRIEWLPAGEKRASTADLLDYRKELEKKAVAGRKLRKKWWLVASHCHNPCRDPNGKVAGLPSFGGLSIKAGDILYAAIGLSTGSVDHKDFSRSKSTLWA